MSETRNGSKCPVTGAMGPKAGGRGTTNRDWWPNQLNLDILHQHTSASNPMDREFNYAEEFKKLDLVSLRSTTGPTTSTSTRRAGFSGPSKGNTERRYRGRT